MTTFHPKKITTFFFFIIFVNQLYATIYPISIDQRIQQSKQIVIGKVVQQYCFWDAEKQNIYTANVLEITAYLKKASSQQYVEFITLGGVLEDEAQIVYPSIDLTLHQAYFFFLEEPPLTVMSTNTQANRTQIPRFCAYSYIQGVLPLQKNNYVDYLDKAPKPINQLIKKAQALTQFVAKQPNGAAFTFESARASPMINARASITLKNGLGASVLHFHAGTTDEAEALIINGSGFGATPGTVQFSDANSGGMSFVSSNYETDLIYWTDTEIQLKIPAKAGTGTVEVYQNDGNLVGSAPITIEWAVNPVFSTYRGYDDRTRQKIQFLNSNELGGYTLQLNTTEGFFGDNQAVSSFERALDQWQCQTGINFQLDKTGTTTAFANDGICVIQYSTFLPAGVLGIATSRFKSVGSSTCSQENTLWYLKEFDIQFIPNSRMSTGFSWNFSAGNPTNQQFDFENIVLHELGHAHGLGHIIGTEYVMHYSVTNGEARKNLSEQEIAAGLHKMSYSTEANCISRYEPMEPLEMDCAAQAVTTTIGTKVKLFLEGNFNDVQQAMHTNLVDDGLLPMEQPFNTTPFSYAGIETITTLPADVVDWVLLQVRDGADMTHILETKALLIRKDGLVINTAGEEFIAFDNLPAGGYYIAVFHRSHLPVISQIAHPFSESPRLYDFTSTESAAMGAAQLKARQNVFMMNAGDFDGNGVINSQDYNLWKQNSSAVNVYLSADVDGNGIINNQDYNLWKANRSKIGMISISE